MEDNHRLAIRLMILQAVLFSIDTATVHYLGPTLSIVQFGASRGFGGVLIAMMFARTIYVFRTEQLRLHLLRGTTFLAYGWVLVYSYGQLPLADATAIAYTQSAWVAVLSVIILGETINSYRWMAVVIGITGALIIAQPSFTEIGIVYLVALFGTSLNALNFVLNRYSNRRDSAETTMAYTHLFAFLGNLPLCLLFTTAPDPSILPWFFVFMVLAPLGTYVGVVAVRYADASMLAPYGLLRLPIGILAGALIFFEIPSVLTCAGIILIFVSCILARLKPSPKSVAQA